MHYTSTRSTQSKVSAAEAILTGLSQDGGLFVPASFGTLNYAQLSGKSYQEIALAVLRVFLPDYDEAFLQTAIDASYGERFENKAGLLAKLQDNLYSLELWHGPTAAFKDYALQLMPHLLVQARHMCKQEGDTIILVATSGDTGKAALEGYKDIEGIKIAVFYPCDGTSEIQRLQMATQQGNNVAVYAVTGNFDDAQRGVKTAFCDEDLAQKLAQRGDKLSSANSINWGRLVPQIVYYVSSYVQLCQQGAMQMGDTLDFCVPTGNFGDIMAGYYAKQMGLPVGTLICASNQNNVLADFLATGRYNAKRDFYKTSSPSMDILVSSNLERLLYHESGQNAEKVNGWMQELAQKGEYTIDKDMLANINKTFAAGWADEQEVAEEIKNRFEKDGYLCDPHTAVAFCVQRKLMGNNNTKPMVVLSTANPFKFSGKVLESLGKQVPENEFEALQALENISGEKAPESLTGLCNQKERFTQVIAPEAISEIPLQL